MRQYFFPYGKGEPLHSSPSVLPAFLYSQLLLVLLMLLLVDTNHGLSSTYRGSFLDSTPCTYVAFGKGPRSMKVCQASPHYTATPGGSRCDVWPNLFLPP